MPRKRRRSKLRLLAMDQALWRWLCDLTALGDEHAPAVIECEFFGDPRTVEEAWVVYGEQATAAYAALHPGPPVVLVVLLRTRCPAWRAVAGGWLRLRSRRLPVRPALYDKHAIR